MCNFVVNIHTAFFSLLHDQIALNSDQTKLPICGSQYNHILLHNSIDMWVTVQSHIATIDMWVTVQSHIAA